VYDPAADALVRERVDRLLEGGLTTDEAVQVALLNNPEFQSLFAQIGASRADVVQSQLLTNPGLNFSVRYPDGGGRPDVTLGLAQELVDLWQIPVRKKIATADLEQLVLNVVQRGVEITGQTRSNCYRVLAFERAERIAAENVQLIEQSLSLTEKRVNAGETSRLDANLVRATLLVAKLDQQDVHRDYLVSQAALARSLGLIRSPTPWKLNDALPPARAIDENDSALLVFGLLERTDAKAKAMQIQAAEGELTRQWLNIVPSLQAGVESESLESRAVPGRQILADTARASIAAGQLTAPSIATRGQRALDRRQIVDNIVGPAFSVTLPIWDQNQAQIAKARFVVEQRRKEYESLLDSIAEDIQQSAAIARIASAQVRFYEEQIIPQANANVEASRKAYEAGEQGIVVLLEAQEFLVSQRRSYVNVLRDYAVAYAALERSLGGRLPSAATTQPAPTVQP